MKLDIPFYLQSTGFTCDPACLMMALKYFYPEIKLSEGLEFEIWREAYGIGIPGCMPQGLAFSALLRRLKATLICKKEKIIEISDKLASGENKKITLFTSEKLLEEAKGRGMEIIDKNPDLEDMERAIKDSKVPIVMIHMNLLYGEDSPHWVVVTGIDKKNVYINDPYNKNGKDVLISRDRFLQMMEDLKNYSEINRRMLIVFK